MDDKSFIWTADLAKRFFQLRFESEWLFKKKKQPWGEFYKILLQNGFPEEMTLNHVRKKWSYTYDSYRIAKKTNNKHWKYYKMFDKHFGKTQVLDKYESWTDEWRLKLIICISEAKKVKLDFQNMWRTVERALRCQHLPPDCCIQDIKGLWHHIRITFNRKYRLVMKNSIDTEDWPLYEAMMEYHSKHEPDYLNRLSSMSAGGMAAIEFRLNHRPREKKKTDDDDDEFQCEIIEQELITNFHQEYQKAKATNNSSWMYFSLFEAYFGESDLTLNPVVGWQEDWVLNLIRIRTDLEHLFKVLEKKKETPWREVEKRLRIIGIPLDHSLLDIKEIWRHLIKTYRWKQKFATKGILNEHWPYFDAVAKYMERRETQDATHSRTHHDCEDDMKLHDLKQKLTVKPKEECASVCRSCSNGDGCVQIFEERDGDGIDLALKLKIIAGVEIDQSDALPSQICLQCLNELENAFKFRRQCQDVDKTLRHNTSLIKFEIPPDDKLDLNDGPMHDYEIDIHCDELTDKPIEKSTETKRRKVIRKKIRKSHYNYLKVCEVCGKHTRNLKGHMSMHSDDKCHSCDICEKKFKFKSGLLVHRATHGAAPKKTCEVCGKCFHIMSQYRRHYAYHANERRYGCETCGKRFNSMDILKVHVRIHTDERPFGCSDCGKTFRTAGCVSRHKRIVHRIVKVQKT